MKKYLIIVFILLFTINLSSNELSWVDTQVDAIKPARQGMSSANLNKIHSPFIFLNKKSKKKSITYAKRAKASSNTKKYVLAQPLKSLILSAIINNSALINGEWYKIKDSVSGYRVSKVTRTSVVLTKGSGELVLSTSDTKRNLKFK